MNIKVSLHAKQRGWERLQLTASDLRTAAVNALTEGIDALGDEVLRGYLIHKALKHNSDGIYVFRTGVFVFKEDTLVTVYPLDWVHQYVANGGSLNAR